MAASTGEALIIFPVEVRGTMHLKDGIEFAPCLTLFTDDSERTSVKRVPLRAEWTRVELAVRVTGIRSLQHCLDHIAAGQLTVAGVTSMRTHVGLTARKSAGMTKLSLGQLYAPPFRTFSRPLRMMMLTDEELRSVEPKGHVDIRAAGPFTVSGHRVQLKITAEQADAAWAQREEQRQGRMAELHGLIKAWYCLFSESPQTFPAARNINCYTLRLDDSTMLPAVAYMMQPLPTAVDPAFFENSLDIVLRREGLTRDQMMALDPMSRRLCNIGVQMLCVYANYVPYAGDEAWVPIKVSDNGADSPWTWARITGNTTAQHIEMKLMAMEEFEVAELFGADDCEGVGFVITRFHQYLTTVLSAQQLSPALARVRSLLAMYAPLLLLCGVTSADLGGDFAALTARDASMGAHMFALFVSLGRLQRMIARCNLTENPFPPQSLQFEMQCTESSTLPTLFGEGTGLLAPLPLDLPERKRLLLPPRIVHDAGVGETYGQLLHEPLSVSGHRPLMVADTRGMRPFTETTGSSNPVFTVNSMFVTDLIQGVYPETFSRGVRKWYHMTSREELTPHFYRTAQLAMTPTFGSNGVNLWSFVFMQRPRGSREQWSVGCLFSDLLNEDDPTSKREVAAWPETPPDAVELAHMIDEMRREPRPPVLHPPPASLGENNTWDPTAPVPTHAQHASMAAALDDVRRAAVRAELHTMLHAIEHAGVRTFVGWPHVATSACACEQALAREVVAADKRLSGVGFEKLVTQFRDVMSRTSLRGGADSNRRRPIVAEFALNYQQLEQRLSSMHKVATRAIRLGDALILPAGMHFDWEHVTADTGGGMVRLYWIVQY